MVAKVVDTLIVLQTQPVKVVRHPLFVRPNEVEVLRVSLEAQPGCLADALTHHVAVRLYPVRAVLQHAVDGVVQAGAKVVCFAPAYCRAGGALHGARQMRETQRGLFW